MPNAGYHTLSLLRPIELYAGDYYSVIVKMTTQYDYPTPAEGMLEGFFTASVNEGESYFASGDVVPSVWVDGKSAGGSGYNATVRVVTVARRSDEVAPEIITASLPVGSIGVRYEYQLEARGSRVIEWRSGRLPEGFALSREGVFSGQSGGPIDKEVKFTAFNDVGRDEAVFRLVIASEDEPVEQVSDDEPVDPEPVISDEPEKIAASGGGGGCDAGLLGMLGLLAMMYLLRRR